MAKEKEHLTTINQSAPGDGYLEVSIFCPLDPSTLKASIIIGTFL